MLRLLNYQWSPAQSFIIQQWLVIKSNYHINNYLWRVVTRVDDVWLSWNMFLSPELFYWLCTAMVGKWWNYPSLARVTIHKLSVISVQIVRFLNGSFCCLLIERQTDINQTNLLLSYFGNICELLEKSLKAVLFLILPLINFLLWRFLWKIYGIRYLLLKDEEICCWDRFTNEDTM